ncbi:MAG TPA: 1,2-phenylacetyl-CoA epoxidase subunit PaaE [Streptosporangiaceae bacterium]|nr:1,2-phenylacetyl-CoA epoxidase subunit PaaE [Streptosporangiaceae bacterium]
MATPAAPTMQARRHAVFHRLRVAEVDRLTDDSVTITFDIPGELRDAYRFTLGQHVTIRCDLGGRGVRRNYSICSPASSERLRIGVKRLPGGAFSSYASERLRPGDLLEVMTPTGRFFAPLDPANAKHYAAIAAGSGITPIMSLLASALEAEPQSQATLLYGNRTTSSIMFLEELHDLKDRYPDRFWMLNFLSREPQEAAMLSGRINRAKLARLFATVLPPGEVDEWFLCGPFDMVQEVRAALAGSGVPQARIHTELFHVGALPPRPTAAQPPAAAGRSTVTVNLDGRATSLELARNGEPILDAVLRARPDAPYACKGGVCGTCRAKLLKGTVGMARTYALEQDEIGLGYVLTCQSHPTSDTVVLDYDG